MKLIKDGAFSGYPCQGDTMWGLERGGVERGG